jgi:type II secretory pathway component GspD/PulD (secretin)
MRYQTLLNVHRTPGQILRPDSRSVTPTSWRRCITGVTLSLFIIAAMSVGISVANAQVFEAAPAGAKVIRSGSPVRSRPATTSKPTPSKPPTAKPASDPKKTADAKDGKKEEGDKKPDVVTRPTKPDSPPNPEELKVVPNEKGMLVLNFQGQPWLEVIRWLKRVSHKTLDWSELPSGYLNLTTHREYTVDEVQSLVNRHLLARGYTILVRGEFMTVEKVEKLNPAMVERVAPEDLDSRDDYEFVKVSFTLTALVAGQAAEELKPMLSSNGKLVPLSKSNRLEALDAVINLREIRDILDEEQSGDGNERRVWQFPLKHVRAEDIVEPLYALLGVQKAAAGPMSSSQMQQLQKMIQAAAAKGGGGAKEEQKVQIVAVSRENVLLVTGPADKIATIKDAVELLDQPSLQSQSLLDSINQTQVYRLENFDPQTFIDTVQELGGLSPLTQIRADTTRGSVIISGTRADHLVVEMLLEKLDGTSRGFHVIALRNRDAEYVAGSIKLMMGLDTEKKEDSRRSYYFNPYGSSRSSSQETKSTDKFQVEADVEYNRLLLRCTDFELKQVEDLLIKLGELPMPGGNQSRRRVFATGDLQDAMQLMDRLKKVWPSRGRNELNFITPVIEPEEEPVILDVPDSPDQLETGKPAPRAADQKPADQKPASKPAGKTAQRSERRKSSNPFRTTQIQFVTASQTQVVESDDATGSEQPAAAAPKASSKPDAAVGTASAAAPAGEPAKDTAPATDTTKSAEPATAAGPVIDEKKADAALQRLIQKMRERAGTGRTEPDAGKTEAPPIEIRISPSGELFIQSDDPAALDLLQEVLDEYAPPKRDWKVIKLKYPQTWAYGVEVILKDIFKEEIDASEDDDNGGMRYSSFYGYYRGNSQSSSKPRRLSARKPLKIISDRDSHTILVQGASDEQLRMIEELIEIYDKPQSTEARSIRKTQIFKIRYSKANVIAEALKDVYRDLLSENDKALQQARGNKKEDRPSERSYTYIYGSGGDDGEEQEQPIRFKGLLSIGIDEAANILIISASEGLLNNVAQIVEELDLAAQPNSSYQVMQVNSRVNLRELQLKLKTMLGPKPPPQQNKNAKGQPQNGNNNNGNNINN